MNNKNTQNKPEGREQLFIDMYKKQAKIAWHINEKASAIRQQGWNRCYALALMVDELEPCKTKVKELSYSSEKPLRRFRENSINVAYACSDSFAPFCGVSVFSLISGSDPQKNYDILIMHSGNLSEINKKHLCALADGRRNISIRIIDCSATQIATDGKLRGYFSSEVYFRCLLMTGFFSEYDRFVYLDSDTVINCDIASLYHRNMNGKPISAANDVCMEYLSNSGNNLVLNGTCISYSYYLKNMLELSNPSRYFNTGVMQMDVQHLRKTDCFDKMLKMIQSGAYYCFEQCVFNAVFKDNINYLPLVWNVQNVEGIYGNSREFVSEKTLSYIKWCIPRYKVMHFVGPDKPWYKPDDKDSAVFVAYASQTAWFRPMIYAALTDKAEEFLQKYSNKK